MQKKSSRSGFTMVELSLSIVFIAILSLSVVLIMLNAISSYHRGLTLNQINTTGMELTDDIRGAIQSSPAQSVKSWCDSFYHNDEDLSKACEDDKGRNFVSVARYADVRKTTGDRKTMNNVPVFGAFCTGTYSYIWNSGYFFTDEYIVKNKTLNQAVLVYWKYDNEGGKQQITVGRDRDKKFKLLKVKDDDRAVCVSATIGKNDNYNNDASRYAVKSESNMANQTAINSNEQPNVFYIPEYYPLEEEPEDLLEGSNNLAIYSLSSAAPAENTEVNALLYAVSFVLGTTNGGINVLASGDNCTAPTDYNNRALENFDYCAINKFNIAAKAANGG